MARLRQWLDAFLAKENSLCLTVKKDRLLFQEEIVYQDRPNEQALIFPLYRDGVKWFEFHEGLPEKELETFFKLMNRFRILKEEAEDDLVTAMWDEDFSYIKYKSADDFWGEEGDSEIVPLQVRDMLPARQDSSEPTPGNPGQTRPISELFDGTAAVNQNSPAPATPSAADGPAKPPPNNVLEQDFGGISWQLSPEEKAYVKGMIDHDRYRYEIRDSLEIILVMMRGIEEERDLIPLAEFMTESFWNLLSRGDLAWAREYLEKMRPLAEGGKPWAMTLAAEFQKRTATEEIISRAISAAPQESPASNEYYNELYRLLLVMIPEQVYALVPVLDKVTDPYLEKALLTIIAVKSSQVGQAAIPVANALSKLRPAALVELTNMIRGHQLPWPTGYLEMLSRHDQSPIREAALLVMLEQSPENIAKLAHMIADPHDGIHQIICTQLSKSRSAVSEKALCDFLGDLVAHDRPYDENRLLNCYRTLGLCATAEALPFLENILLKGGLMSKLGQSGGGHRQGAALALMMMPEAWGSAEILKKAAKSPFKAIRLACQAAEQAIRGNAHV